MLRHALLWAVLALVGVGASGASAASLPDAEIFATSNRATITDPMDPRLTTRLVSFQRTVEAFIRHGNGIPRRSRLLEGVFFDSELQATTFERSREFDVDRVTRRGLRRIAHRIRRVYHQRSVLTFDYPEHASDPRDAIEVVVRGIDAQRFRDGLLADKKVRETLVGGSRTLDGQTILIAARKDLPLAKRFIGAVGGDFAQAKVRRGHREFVG